MQTCIAIIPARGGSKRLPGKNAKLLGDLPLIAHSIRYAQNQPEIQKVYVSTDDSQIAEIAVSYGAEVIWRPDYLSTDEQPTVTALQHVIESVKFEGWVALFQATNPLRPVNLFSECYQTLQKTNADSLFTVSRNHHKLGKIANQKFIPFNYEPGQRSQDLEPLYFENGLLYLSRSKVIMDGKIITTDAFPFQMDHVFGQVDIDTADDFEYAEYLLNRSTSK